MRFVNGAPVFGIHADNTLQQLLDVSQRAARVALMADGHLGYIMPVGGVAAYHNAVSVAGVGYDIACGNAAIRTSLNIANIRPQHLTHIADEIQATISFGIGRSNQADDAPTDDPLFEDEAWEILPPDFREKLRQKAIAQIGTVGSGNHYVDVFSDENGTIWVGVHFGSRGLGHTIATSTMAVAQGGKWGDKSKEQETILQLNPFSLGEEYWALMQLAGRYAYLGREEVARKVVQILGTDEQELVHNHHNFAWRETHFNDDNLVVVRKGATPAFPNQLGFVGGSMGDNAVILRGVEAQSDEILDYQRWAMFSTVHGAGRVMSRTEAAGKRNRKTGEIRRPGRVSQEMMTEWLEREGVILRGGGLDESPHAYRRLPEVLEEQEGTIEVLHTLKPLIVVMAGSNEFDPYKD